MEQLLSRPFLNELLIGYMALFSIINPFGVSFVFLNLTRGLTEAERHVVAHRIGIYSFAILVVSLFIGSQVLRVFGVSLSALRIAGGLVVALSGWSMLNAPDSSTRRTDDAPDASHMQEMIFFPLTVPLTTGPGSIAAAIALGANRTGHLRELAASVIASLLVAVMVAGTVTLAYANAGLFSRWVGREGTRVITRMSAFLLMCVGVQIVLTGVSGVMPGLIAQHE
jgi:multiple antibiotic resistance protein